jgi:uncharacterized protein YjdB
MRVIPLQWRPPNVAHAAALGILTVAGAMSCARDSLDPDRSAVSSVVVTPNRLSVGVGATAPLLVEVRDAAGSLLTDRKVAWASKDPKVATVSASGVVTGVTPGPVQIAATAEGKSAIVDVTVNPKSVASIRLSPAGDQQMLIGQTRQMTAQTLDSDGNQLTGRAITWSTSSTAVATVSTSGLITAVAAGGAVITATSEGRTAVVAVTVSAVPIASITVAPVNDTVVVSQTLQLTGVAKDAQGATLPGRQLAWTSSDATKATVSSTGLVTGVAPGAVTITAGAEGKSGTSSITIKPKPVGAVILSPAQVSVEVGATRQLTAQVTDEAGNVLTGRPVSFVSDNVSVATVSGSGLVTGVAVGTAKITATSEGKSGTADLAVTPVPVSTVEISPGTSDLTIGQSTTLAAVAKDAKGNVLTGRTVVWTSGAPTVATVSATGVVTAVGAGSAVIFATIEGKIGTATVNVRQLSVTSVTVAPASNNIAVNASVQLGATVRSGSTILTDRVVGWTSSNDAVAVVSSAGRVTGLKAGAVTITATSEGVSGTAFVAVGIASVTVTPNPTSVFIGATRQLTATARDASNATVQGVPFQWSSAAIQTATVDGTGLVTGKALGTVNITAAVGSVTGSSAVTVQLAPVATVTVLPATATIPKGGQVQLTATLKDANGNILTGRTVTWTSNSSVAGVSSSGLVKGSSTATGTATITATSEGKKGTATITVTAP